MQHDPSNASYYDGSDDIPPSRVTPKPDPLKDPEDPYQPLGKPLTAWNVAEGTLKHPARILFELFEGRSVRVIVLQVIIGIVSLAAYGLTVGSFSLGDQLWLAPLKITTGVLLSALICLPSLFVFSCLAGADSTPSRMIDSLSGLITVASLLLLAFGPVSWIFAQSTGSIVFMGCLHLVFWLIALHYGFEYIRTAMFLSNGRCGNHLNIWCIVFLVVSLQMTTTLRPILGRSEKVLQSEKVFFLTHWLNAF